MAKRRKNGEGTWGTKMIKGVEYKYYRNSDGKYFYGKTEKDIKEKIKKFESNTHIDSKTTFGEYIVWYFENVHKNTVNESTHSTYMDVVDAILKNEYYNIGNIQMGSFSREHNYFVEYVNAITPHYSYNYILGQVVKIKMAVKYAEKHNQIVPGISEDIKTPHEDRVGKQKKKVPFLTKQIADSMYSIIDDTYYNGSKKYGFYYWIVLLIIHTGLRSEELKALRLNDVDFESKELKVDECIVKIKDRPNSTYRYLLKSTKNTQSERTIPLNLIAIDMLNRIIAYSKPKKDSDFICECVDGKPIVNEVISKSSDRLLRDCKSPISHCSPHALRHTFGSILYDQEVPLKTISELMGHKNIQTTANIYIGLTKEHKDNSVSKLEP